MKALKTLSDIIDSESIYDMKNLSMLISQYGYTMVDYTIFEKYKTIIDPYIITVDVDESDRQKYSYKPELLCHNLYGDMGIAWIVMYINGFESRSTFKIGPKLKLFRPSEIKDIITNVISKANDALEENKNENGL